MVERVGFQLMLFRRRRSGAPPRWGPRSLASWPLDGGGLEARAAEAAHDKRCFSDHPVGEQARRRCPPLPLGAHMKTHRASLLQVHRQKSCLPLPPWWCHMSASRGGLHLRAVMVAGRRAGAAIEAGQAERAAQP